MNKTVTLLEFLESTGARVRIHDIGRRVTKISRTKFLQFETQQSAYPYPLQQQAWFAISMTDPADETEPVIWFLRFPLDETGKLQQAGRDYFIHRLLEASVTKDTADTSAAADALKDNPHVFKPREDKMAVFHARLSHLMKQPPSRYYAHAREYISGQQGWEQWNFVGFQGIADLAEHLNEDGNEKLVSKAIDHLPHQPLEALCQCLENIRVPYVVAEALYNRCQKELCETTPDASILANLVRAISLSSSDTLRHQLISSVMQSGSGSQDEVVAAIAARAWEWLQDKDNASLYLENLSQSGQDTFNQCLVDLLFMPGLRDILLTVIRDPQRSDKLAQTFSNMMKNLS